MQTLVTKIIPIPAFKDNYIWILVQTAQKSAWLVDPGEARGVIEYLEREALSLKGVLLTHHHQDHSGGIPDLLKHFGEVPVFGSSLSPCTSVNQKLEDANEIVIGGLNFKVMAIPGHTLDHLAYYNDEMLFCGDTLFSAGCGKVFEGTPAMMYASISKLMDLGDKVSIYCGHEYTKANLIFAQHVEPTNQEIQNKLKSIPACSLPSVLGEEKKFNPFLRCEELTVINAVEGFVGKKTKSAVEVFQYLREWKNSFVSTT